MRMFYSCFIESALTFTFISWYGCPNQKNKLKLQAIVSVCCKVAGTTLNDLPQSYKPQIFTLSYSQFSGSPATLG